MVFYLGIMIKFIEVTVSSLCIVEWANTPGLNFHILDNDKILLIN